ncbi:MD-2-related lipid-recognition protein [Nomia melanderi]|uniref:MD-2-related lipid-recognition protein n=1 Tax=Nomia melanderi TaxID=2448451 RepID=UPI0013043F92|nr:MD-2-related lipid-recognition protein-like [Nomia melanderi]
MNRNSDLVLIFLAVGLTLAFAEVVPIRECPYPDSNVISNCTVHEVHIEPCREAVERKPCKLRRGVSANMTIHYTPNFSAEEMDARVFWASELTDIPFLGMDPNACLSTTCPVEAGRRSVFHMEIPILKKYPVRMFDLKWRVRTEQGDECCFMYQIKITK